MVNSKNPFGLIFMELIHIRPRKRENIFARILIWAPSLLVEYYWEWRYKNKKYHHSKIKYHHSKMKYQLYKIKYH
jgi:hypothetical protein